MNPGRWSAPLLLMVVSIAAACADADNPTALQDLDAEVTFEVADGDLETFTEIEFHVEATDGGSPMEVDEARLEMEHVASGAMQTVDMEQADHGYAAHVTFFQPGEHHVHFTGRAHRHTIRWEFGETEVDIGRHHQVVGPYWVELELDPAPVFEGDEAHIHLLVFDYSTGALGAPVSGLSLSVEIHAPNGTETAVSVTEEEPGEYEAAHQFGTHGAYELHLEIDVGGQPEEGEFHIPVLDPDAPGDADQEPGSGGGHDHG